MITWTWRNAALFQPDSNIDHLNGDKCTGFDPQTTVKRWAGVMNQRPFQDKSEKLNELNAFPLCLPKRNKSKAAGMMTKGRGGTVLVEVLDRLAEVAMYTIKCVCFLLG